MEQQGYKVTFSPVSVSHIDRLVDEGKMYLFQIYNKDFSPSSKGTPNMHTLYWRALFDGQNLADVVYKLNGEAELFFRRRSLSPSRPTHPAGVPIANKNRQNEKQTSTFDYDLTKDRRFTVDKVMFHVPVTLNFKSTGNSDINQQVRAYLQTADDAHVIGIDRGERHLLYLVVIDRHGHIKEQCSLNEIVNEYNGNSYRTNYHDLLDRREKDRLEARQSWKSIETIKELKEGHSVYRELMMVKVRANASQRMAINAIAEICRASVVDVGRESVTVMLTGDQSKLDAMINLLEDYEILELARTGLTGLSRGADDIRYLP